jgi:hypothetical protein
VMWSDIDNMTKQLIDFFSAGVLLFFICTKQLIDLVS